MTDNEIIKALERCSVGTFACDEQCPCFHSKSNLKVTSCRFELVGDALDLVNRQNAEVAKLQGIVRRLKQYDEVRDIRLHARLTEKARAEAIKEFAERLKGIAMQDGAFGYVDCYDIDNLIKEMVGADDEQKQSNI
jgi:hypothetical protein